LSQIGNQVKIIEVLEILEPHYGH